MKLSPRLGPGPGPGPGSGRRSAFLTGPLLATLLLATAVGIAPGRARAGAPPEGPAKFFPPPPPVPPGVKPSIGCQSPSITTGTRQRRVQVDGASRSFALVVPAGAQPQVPLPLVFVWHGLGDSGGRARVYFGVEQQSQRAAVFIYADGSPLPARGKRRGWDLRPDGADLKLFDALLKEAGSLVCLDEARVFAVGHGAGGDFAHALACHRPSLVRGIAAVSSGLPSGACPGKGVAVWAGHGKNDSVVPFTRGAAARDHWLAANGCSNRTRRGSPASCLEFEGCAGKASVQFCAHGGNDDWPTFAGAAIWRFFAGLR